MYPAAPTASKVTVRNNRLRLNDVNVEPALRLSGLRKHWICAVLLMFGLAALGVLYNVGAHWGECLQADTMDGELRLNLVQLDGPNGKQAEDAIRRMGRGAIPLLLNRVRMDESLSSSMMYVLSLFGPEALPELVAAFRDPNEAVRVSAIGAIVLLGRHVSQAVPALTRALCDSSPQVRLPRCWHCMRLGLSGSKRCRP